MELSRHLLQDLQTATVFEVASRALHLAKASCQLCLKLLDNPKPSEHHGELSGHSLTSQL